MAILIAMLAVSATVAFAVAVMIPLRALLRAFEQHEREKQ